MGYAYSHLDHANIDWHKSDNSAHTLLAMKLEVGHLRDVPAPVSVEFRYPITAIAGQNGSGKTTLLAMAACAYHNTAKKFNPFGRENPYYTMSDFFIQAADDEPVDNVFISYQYLHERWKSGSKTRAGSGRMVRGKKTGGRWTNYDRRVRRSVAFLGINRVVPESERRVLRSYSRKFVSGQASAWEAEVANSVGRVLGRNYTKFEYLGHRAYRLPVVESNGRKYSGFNMGAGESALFELFATIFACDDPLLLVVDELELGLHEEAQVKLVDELKSLCKKRKLQVVCTTHSGAVLSALPPEGRLFLERRGSGKLEVLAGLSREFATSKLAGRSIKELDILVEDEVAEAVVRGALGSDARSRVRILAVGSHDMVLRYLAMRVTERGDRGACALLDGDQRGKMSGLEDAFIRSFEKRNDDLDKKRLDWLADHLGFLPGSEWPERWVVSSLSGPAAGVLDSEYGMAKGERGALKAAAIIAGKHNELFEVSRRLNLLPDAVLSRLVSCSFADDESERTRLAESVEQQLRLGCVWPAP